MHAPSRTPLLLPVLLSTHSPYPPRSLVRDGQTSPHRPRLVVSRSTCLHSPHANVIGPITSKLPVIKHTPKSDSTVESLPERFLCRAAARCEWVSRWLWDGHGHGVCDRNHLLACCHAATFLRVQASCGSSLASRRFLRLEGGESCFIAKSSD